MGIRNKQVSAEIVIPVVAFLLYVFWSVAAFGSTFQHYIQQVRRTDGQVMAGAQVQVFLPGSNTRATIYSNISGTTIKSQPITTDSVGFFDFYLGDQVVDILIQGNNFPTTKLLNVTLSALATAGILTVPNGGTGVNSFTLNTVLLGNGTLPIKVSSAGLANQVFRVPSAGGQPDFGAINLASSAAVSGVLPPANGGTGSPSGSVLRVKEQDGAPNVPNVTEIRVSNGTLTDIGGGVISVTTSTGSSLPVIDTTNIVSGSVDPTKLMRFEVDGFTSGATRVLTPPNADITIAGANFANAWADGVKQTFNPSATTAGINLGAHTADPSVPVNGDTFYNSTTNKFRCYENGSWKDCSTGTPGGADTNIQFNDSSAFGGESNFIWNKTTKFFGIGATAAIMDEAMIATNLASHNGVIASLRANNDAPPGNSAGFRAFKARGTVGAPSAVQSGDWMLGLSSNAHDGTGYFGTARIYSAATQTHTNVAHGTEWVFGTTPNGSTTLTDWFKIQQNGHISNPSSTITAFDNHLVVFTASATATDASLMQLLRSRGSIASPSAVSSGDELGRFDFGGHDGTSYFVGSRAGGKATQNWTGSAHGAKVTIGTIPNGSTISQDRVSIDHTGQILIQEGSNQMMGASVLVGGTVTVSNTLVTANSRIFLTSQVDGGTPGFLRVSARNAGTDFTITSSSGTDTSTVAWLIFDANP